MKPGESNGLSGNARNRWSKTFRARVATATIAALTLLACENATQGGPGNPDGNATTLYEANGTWVVYQERFYVKLVGDTVEPTTDGYYLVIDSNTVTFYRNDSARTAGDGSALPRHVACFTGPYARIGNTLTLAKALRSKRLRITGTDLLAIDDYGEAMEWYKRYPGSLPAPAMAWPPTQDPFAYTDWSWNGACYE